MDEETKKRLTDFFDTAYLADFLGIPVAELVERFEDYVDEHIEDLEDEMRGQR